jgi:hypothetical protein
MKVQIKKRSITFFKEKNRLDLLRSMDLASLGGSRYTRSKEEYLGRGVHNALGLEIGPLEALPPDRETQEHKGDGHGLETHLFSLVKLGVRGPGEELGDVFGELGGVVGGSVLVLDDLVVDGTGHGDGAAREVRVVVQALTDVDARGRVVVASQEGENVILFIVFYVSFFLVKIES